MIKKVIIGVVLNALALYLVVYLMPKELVYTGGIPFFLIGGLVMGVLNTFLKPVLKLLTLPLQILTIGLSLIVISGFGFLYSGFRSETSRNLEPFPAIGITIFIFYGFW